MLAEHVDQELELVLLEACVPLHGGWDSWRPLVAWQVEAPRIGAEFARLLSESICSRSEVDAPLAQQLPRRRAVCLAVDAVGVRVERADERVGLHGVEASGAQVGQDCADRREVREGHQGLALVFENAEHVHVAVEDARI